MQEPLAIIGMSCRLPGGADDPEALWKLLEQERDCIVDVPPERWRHANWHHPDPDAPGHTVARQAGFLRQVADFDAEFFGISPREAESMDPQHRLLLELAVEATERAGLPLESLAGSATGVFVGISTYDYGLHADRFCSPFYTATGTAVSIAANRISYALDLRGPSLAVDTACSSSLTALDCAWRSLHSGQCRQALVGAVNLMVEPTVFVGFSTLHMLSASNRCRAFDVAADGYVRAEGGGMLVLKPLSAARADGDRIEGLILATGANQDGRSNGLTAPNPEAQEALLAQIYSDPELANRLAYVEAHGTGTPLGDPIEARSLATVLDGRRRLWIGSVKTNLGHLEAAAGMAGLLKAVLCLQHSRIPANLHFQQPSLDLDALALAVPTRMEILPEGAVIGVNSFGFGGSNGHAVLAAAPASLVHPPAPRDRYLIPLSAHTACALRARVAQFAELPVELAYSLARRSTHHPYRMTVQGSTTAELTEALRAWVPSGQRAAASAQPVFVFCGQGSQWAGMGRALLQAEPVFRAVVEECDRRLFALGGWSLLEVLEDAERLSETAYAQPAIFAIQAGLVALWRSWGIEPAAVIGHSVGEIAAAFTAGVLSLEQAVEVVFQRAATMENASVPGRMLAVEMGPEEVPSTLAIGAFNGPRSLTLTGPAAAIEDFASHGRPVPVRYAFHSSLMDPVEAPLRERLSGLRPSPARLPMISTVTGRAVEGPELDVDYWWANVRRPVLFFPALQQLEQTLFLEVGPHPVLTANLLDLGPAIRVLPGLHRRDEDSLLRSLGQFWCMGAPVNWAALYPTGEAVTLPSYPWQRERYWPLHRDRQRGLQADRPFPLLGCRCDHSLPSWQGLLDGRLHPFLLDHRFEGKVLVSATTFIEVALEAARAALGDGPLALLDIQFERPCFVEQSALLQTTLDEDRFVISSLTDQEWIQHASGRLQSWSGALPVPPARPELPELSAGWVRDRLAGLQFGPSFQGLGRTWQGAGQVLAEIDWPASDSMLTHPGGLDSCMQTLLSTFERNLTLEPATCFPASIEEVRFYGSPVGRVWSLLTVHEKTTTEGVGDLVVFDEEKVLITFRRGHWRTPEARSGRSIPADRLLLEPCDDEETVAGEVVFAASDEMDPVDQMVSVLDLVRSLEGGSSRLSLSPGAPVPLQGFVRALRLEHPSLIACPEPRWRSVSLKELDRRTFKAGPEVYEALCDRPGLLEQVVWRAADPLRPGPGEVHLRVEATGLNFSDVMKALNLYPGPNQGLGSECAGTVLEVGTGVSWPQPGDRVVALGARTLASRAVVSALLTAPWPAELEAAKAAALPLVSVTASLALERLAGLQAGERVLIHSATGGVGLAALAVARRLGAEIHVSAGTPEKRAYLQAMGIEHVYDSRGTSFPAGMDVVLNSLAGEGLVRSLECLAPLGRFVEIGKSDIYANRRLALHPFRQGATFVAFDLELWMRHRPAEVGRCLREVMARAESLPTRSFPRGEMVEALRTLSTGQHRGKLAVVAEGPVLVGATRRLRPELDPRATYLVTGGLTGFGAALVAWLVECGARHLLLLSRRGMETPGARAFVDGLSAHVVVGKADVQDPRALETLADMPPLRGVFHAANQMDDGIALSLDRERLERVYGPKARGAWNLHQLTLDCPLDYFVLFSSISSAFGAFGQANYCAANAYLDWLAHYRRALGLPALSVNWGPVQDAGYLAEHPEVLAQLEARGHRPLQTRECLDVLGRLLLLKPTQVAVAHLPSPTESSVPVEALPVLEFLEGQAERILRVRSLRDQHDRPLRDLGFDSLMAVELRNAIEERFRVSLPMREFLRGPSLLELSAFLEGKLPEPAPAGELAHLSDEEVERLLAQLEG